MRRRVLFAIALQALFVCAVAAGQPPKAVITGPKTARCGAMVMLSASESQGTKRVWALVSSPSPETTFGQFETAMFCVFADPMPGNYIFALAVAGADANGGPLIDLVLHTVTMVQGAGPPPSPAPDPTPPPGVNPYAVPAANLLTAVQPIATIKTTRADATNLAQLYQDASRLVASAPAARAAGTKPEIGTTAELRAWLVANGQELGLRGRHAGLADAVDRYLGQQLGTAIRDVTAADAEALAALAWGVWEGGK